MDFNNELQRNWKLFLKALQWAPWSLTTETCEKCADLSGLRKSKDFIPMPDPLYELNRLLGSLEAKVDQLTESQVEMKEMMVVATEQVEGAVDRIADLTRTQADHENKLQDHQKKIERSTVFQQKVGSVISVVAVGLTVAGYGVWYLITAFLPDLLSWLRKFLP